MLNASHYSHGMPTQVDATVHCPSIITSASIVRLVPALSFVCQVANHLRTLPRGSSTHQDYKIHLLYRRRIASTRLPYLAMLPILKRLMDGPGSCTPVCLA